MPGTPENTKKENERELNFWESLYLPELFKGLGYSFGKIVDEPTYTFEYPEEQWYPPDSYRGRPVLVEEDGRPRCVSCNLCARACPPLAINMQSHEVKNVKEREPEMFEIDMLRCIYCGYCEEVCPEEAIIMSKEYDLTFQSRDEAVFDLEDLLRPTEQMQDRLEYLDQYKNKPFGQQWEFRKDNNLHSVKDQDFLGWLAAEGMEELGSTHLRDDPMATDGDQDWGSPRHGTPQKAHAAE